MSKRERDFDVITARAPLTTRLAPVGLAALLVGYLAVPLLALIWRGANRGTVHAFSDPLVQAALWLTLKTTALVVLIAIVLGTPLAIILARREFRGKALVEGLVELPIALPPVIAGVGLLMAFGRRGIFGPTLEEFGITLPFTTAAVVLAQLFVSIPFYVRAATLGFRAVPRELEEAAAVDGAGGWATFRHVTAPLALPGILSGALLCGTRAASEFGATLMFAGNLAGRTQTLTLAVMTAMETDIWRALALAVLLMMIAVGVVIGARALVGGRDALL
ncbi:ABC transporter permease [Pyrinomonas methylaliphatogenes]|uniref:Molybdenum transport system permease n=1 Tax=Pyrinomonas methylaliphatogenes TaxID=454194 RepID=A0A0B6WZ18_9BACT|nr:ABC transporter permease [Pyrinomonas methylaliphatogenes]CDM65410.1 molybdate ABC transporter, permease protein [Pyrinomonas methylaliphatogenes]